MKKILCLDYDYSSNEYWLQLQKVDVKVFSNDQCKDYFKEEDPYIQIYDSVICVGLVPRCLKIV